MRTDAHVRVRHMCYRRSSISGSFCEGPAALRGELAWPGCCNGPSTDTRHARTIRACPSLEPLTTCMQGASAEELDEGLRSIAHALNASLGAEHRRARASPDQLGAGPCACHAQASCGLARVSCSTAPVSSFHFIVALALNARPCLQASLLMQQGACRQGLLSDGNGHPRGACRIRSARQQLGGLQQDCHRAAGPWPGLGPVRAGAASWTCLAGQLKRMFISLLASRCRLSQSRSRTFCFRERLAVRQQPLA